MQIIKPMIMLLLFLSAQLQAADVEIPEEPIPDLIIITDDPDQEADPARYSDPELYADPEHNTNPENPPIVHPSLIPQLPPDKTICSPAEARSNKCKRSYE
ncbi:MAG: hypothetical protein V4629_06885 [Pseudomonadota bacterium]